MPSLAGLAELLALGLDHHVRHELFDLVPAPAVPALKERHNQAPAPAHQPLRLFGAPQWTITAQAGDTAEAQAGGGRRRSAPGLGPKDGFRMRERTPPSLPFGTRTTRHAPRNKTKDPILPWIRPEAPKLPSLKLPPQPQLVARRHRKGRDGAWMRQGGGSMRGQGGSTSNRCRRQWRWGWDYHRSRGRGWGWGLRRGGRGGRLVGGGGGGTSRARPR